MKIYTKTGDRGETSIIGGKRLPKSHPRIEAYGTVDELIAMDRPAAAPISAVSAVKSSSDTDRSMVMQPCCSVIARTLRQKSPSI